MNKKLSAPDGTIALFVKLGISDARILEHLYLSALGRYPSAAERQSELANLAKAENVPGPAEAKKEARRQALEDMLWALVTSKEFLFNY
ncbi:MAG: hypothetical protein LC126_06530 [Bryobacterales bacterium]|nr:hypothetical protein [Bryobacterales bacterium]